MDINKLREALQDRQKVCSKQCDQCLFSAGRIVSGKRMKELMEDCAQKQTHFICHKGSIAGVNLVCRGFFEHRTTPYLELMKATQNIEYVDPMTLEKQKNEKKNTGRKRKGKGL